MLSVFHVPFSVKITAEKCWFFAKRISPQKVYFLWTKGRFIMITLNNNIYAKYLRKLKHNASKNINGFYKKNRLSVFIYDLSNKLKYAIILNDGMVCNASKLDNGQNWFQYHLANEDFKGFITSSELDFLKTL